MGADLNVSAKESPYLAFIVGLHVATAIALMIYFWREWMRIIGGFFSSIRDRHIVTADQRLAWMIIIATIPVGVAGLVLEHTFRVLLGKPIPASHVPCRKRLDPVRRGAAAQEGVPPRRRGRGRRGRGGRWQAGAGSAAGHRAVRQQEAALDLASDRRLSDMGYVAALLIGSSQILALLAGISRSGITMVTGLLRGLSHEDAARFAFLLATPVILAAGAAQNPRPVRPARQGNPRPDPGRQPLSGVGAYLSVRFLTKYFQTRTLTPFAIYCLVAGIGSFIYLSAT